MFQRKKYNRRQRTGRKRIIRARKSYNNRKQLPPTAQPLSKLGTNDISYVDRSFTTTYSWTTVKPVAVAAAIPASSNKIPSLRQICSVELANNASMLTQAHLQTAPWSVWKRVWHEILQTGNDSIVVYQEFSSVFGKELDFKCHENNTSDTVKDTMIDMYRIPNARKHRIETVFANVYLTDIVTFIASFKYVPYVMLDLSMTKLNNDVLFSVFHIQKLMCIDLSNSNIDDNYLIQLGNAVSQGKLANLTILKVNRCMNVTVSGIKSLFEKTEGSLACIETDISLPITRYIEPNHGYVSNMKWIKLDTDTMPASLILKLPLALKLHTLLRFYGDIIVAKPAGVSITKDLLRELRLSHVFDLLVMGSESSDDVSRMWEERIRARNRIRIIKSYHHTSHNQNEKQSN
ncbi:uncharacterized protein SPAPADRAFT_65114 [Spathaspora passalidarum NRRL Y-27907]|uniref:Uncharacterized protein n=1 Tax=Spathaspora passalidarum (strain NRRL Y-27907 / 11-Y1) TaxID=619300 RepID=G3AJK6_SPAPN|nr:uncharacterized protein SPAPADRAFT_65114 [Spathaspora passalidarum NRRL Y-27907]EGW33909.1 hypothetical protein SPAPADRAFT_65114 [Spathaspora passalidarum NRRL Y-27907]